MVRTVYTSQGVHAGFIWGHQQWGSQEIGEFYGRAAGSRKTLGMFVKIDDAKSAVLDAFRKNVVRIKTEITPPAKQLSLRL